MYLDPRVRFPSLTSQSCVEDSYTTVSPATFQPCSMMHLPVTTALEAAVGGNAWPPVSTLWSTENQGPGSGRPSMQLPAV